MSVKILVLTEKREAASDMAATLGDPGLGNNASGLATLGKQQGYLEGETYLFTWAAGHLFSQIKPKEIDPEYGLYQRYEDLNLYKMPKLREEITHIPTNDRYKQRQRKIIESLLSRNDVREIIIATDADAEGEAIGRDMVFKIKPDIDVPIKRFWNTGSFKARDAVSKAMKYLKPYNDDKFNNLYDSQVARSVSDYLTGMKITKTLTDLYGKPFYTGRVKSVIIALLGNRAREINNFVAKDFWQIKGKKDDLELSHFFYVDVEDFDAKGNPIVKKEKQRNYYKKEEVDAAIQATKDRNGTVEKMSTTTTSTKSRPLPLSGSDFASEMMGRYKISYGQCNAILDYLRQEGFTTYPGTNGRYFAPDDKEDVVNALNTANSYFDKNAEFTLKSYIFNAKKAAKQNHTPLSLTSKIPTPKDLDTWAKHSLPRIQEAYELIGKRILVAFLEDDKIEKQELVIGLANGQYKFDLTGQKAIHQGWRTFMGMEIVDSTFKSNEPLKEGDKVTLDSIYVKTSKTKCPSPYTTKSLLDTLLNVTRVVDNLIKESEDPDTIQRYRKVKKALKNAEGIGTDRTRERIIKDLLENKMIASKGKKEVLSLTQAGDELYRVLPPKLKSVVLTANWENIFEGIRQGTIDAEKAIKNIDDTIMEDMIPAIINDLGKDVGVSERKTSKRVETNVACPLCKKPIIETDKVFKCSANIWSNGKQKGCKFSIFKDQSKFYGDILTEEDLPELFSSTKENPLKKNKKAIYFDAKNKYFVAVIFEGTYAPDSNSENKDMLIETKGTFRKNGKFVYKEFRGKKLTKIQAEKLLDGKKVTLSLKSKAGKAYKLACTLNDNGSLSGEFA